MTYPVTLTRVAEQPTAVIRGRALQGDLPAVIPPLCGEVWEYVKQAGDLKPGKLLVLYFDTCMNFECGVEVAAPFLGTQRVYCSTTPAGPVAMTTHIGPYANLGQAHDAVQAWCKDNGYAMDGRCWETYGHWSDDPAQLFTDVTYLLKE